MAKKKPATAAKPEGKITVTIDEQGTISLSRWPNNAEEKADIDKQVAALRAK